MSALKGDTATTAQIWGQDLDFQARASAAVPDGLLRDIVGDAYRSRPHERQGFTKPLGGTGGSVGREPSAVVPSFREWAHARLGVLWDEDRARDYHARCVMEGKDVGPLRPQSPPSLTRAGGPSGAPGSGIPPGVRILDQMMDVEDALDRVVRARNGGRW
jgi:hypothetical protein